MRAYSRGTVRLKELKSGRAWQAAIRFKDEGGIWRTVTRMLDADSKRQAQAELDRWRIELESAEHEAHGMRDMVPLSEYMGGYIGMLGTSDAVEPSTVKDYMATMRRIADVIGSVPIGSLTTADIAAFESGMTADGYAPATVNKAHRLLKQVLKHAVAVGDIPKNPCDAVKPPKRRSQEPNALDADSRRRLVAFLDGQEPTPVIVGISLALYAGLRVGECCGLKWCDVDLQRSQIKVTESIGIGIGGSYAKAPKTEKSRRAVDIPPQLCEMLRRRRMAFVDQCMECGIAPDPLYHVLSNDIEHAMSPTALSKAWTVIADANGFRGITGGKVRFHDLRHTYATVAIASGVDVKSVSSMLGHANAAMTLNIYASADPDAKRAAAAKIGDAFSAS